MSTVNVTSQTQQITVDPSTSVVTVTSAGPQGPPGAIGNIDPNDLGVITDEIDTRVATHEQATPIHTNSTSGRDFAAFFQNGLI